MAYNAGKLKNTTYQYWDDGFSIDDKGLAKGNSDSQWPGGVKADRYYPERRAKLGSDKSTERVFGYVSKWDSSSYLEPVYREAVWVTIEICELFKSFEPVVNEEKVGSPYKADILFMFDDSYSMDNAELYGGSKSTPLSQLRDNINHLLDKLINDATGLGSGKNDVRYGVVTYQSNIHAVTDTIDSVPNQTWATTRTEFKNLLDKVCCTNEDTGEIAWTEKDRGRTSAKHEYLDIAVNPFNLTDVAGALHRILNSSSYTWRTDDTVARFIIMVTDTVDEVRNPELTSMWQSTKSQAPATYTIADFIDELQINSFKSSVTPAEVLEELKEQKVTMAVVAMTPTYYNAYVQGTDGISFKMQEGGKYNWGTTMAEPLANLIIAKASANERTEEDSKDWWSNVAEKWGPVIYYHYTPVQDFEHNSLITVFHDDVAFMTNGSIIRNRINWLTCFDNYPALGGEAQDSFYLPGLIPGEEQTQVFIVRNESYSGIMKKIDLQLLDVPDDVTIQVDNFPEQLYPRKTAAISITAKYDPAGGASATPPARHIDIHYALSYWMTHILSCGVTEEEEEDIFTPPMISTPDIYFVESNQRDSFTTGYVKDISFDPMYTLTYVTETAYKEDDLTEQESWTDRLYILEKETVNSANFERIMPVPITAIAGYDTATTGCCWLKVRGPAVWTTTRKFTCTANTKTWYIVNQSLTRTYVAHPVMNPETAPDHKGMGFILFEYPDGNIVPPGESRRVTIKWQPIFNPAGEEMTKKTTRHAVKDCQEGSVESIWSMEDGFFNSLLYGMATGKKDVNGNYTVEPDYGTYFTHTYIETIEGDGIIPHGYSCQDGSGTAET